MQAGRIAGHAIERAAAMALAGEVDAIVTAPIEKHALHQAGFRWPGHTEWLAELAGGVDVAMMLASDRLRVVLVTTHVALRDVPALVTQDRVVRTGRVTLAALRDWFGVAAPRLALCALNPHAGEGGLFGDEDERVLRPAAAALGAAGPLPADTVFVRAMRGEFDAVLAPYHDVGMTAIKVASFGKAVNVTLGLPFPRTSPDHGTAFDIAGTGRADPSSMRAAIEMAVDAREETRTEDRGLSRSLQVLSPRLLLLPFRRHHPHLLHPPPLHRHDLEGPRPDDDAVPDPRQPPELAEEKSAERRIVPVVEFHPPGRVEFRQGHRPVEQRGLPGRRRRRVGPVAVMLVEDRPDDLLQQVLHRHQPRRAPVLVEHHREVDLEPLHVGQHVLDFPGAGHEERLAPDAPDGRRRDRTGGRGGRPWPAPRR